MRKITCLEKAFHFLLVFTLLGFTTLTCGPAFAEQQEIAGPQQDQTPQKGSDPYARSNRKIFQFNDCLYFKVVKPIANAYSALPHPVRRALGNGFQNLEVPSHFVNFALQGRAQLAGDEMTRFIINSTVGVAGMFDVARNALGIEDHDADFGQTLGKWGLEPGPYLLVPVLGPSDSRDLFGFAVDKVMDPLFWVPGPWWITIPPSFVDFAGKASNHSGDYEALKKASLDPYVAMRDAYQQYRADRVLNK